MAMRMLQVNVRWLCARDRIREAWLKTRGDSSAGNETCETVVLECARPPGRRRQTARFRSAAGSPFEPLQKDSKMIPSEPSRSTHHQLFLCPLHLSYCTPLPAAAHHIARYQETRFGRNAAPFDSACALRRTAGAGGSTRALEL